MVLDSASQTICYLRKEKSKAKALCLPFFTKSTLFFHIENIKTVAAQVLIDMANKNMH